MLKTGKEHVESLRDGRVVYLGSERIDDVTTHPAFRNAVRTAAMLYDTKADPAQRETMTYEEDGGRHFIYYLRPQTRDDLQYEKFYAGAPFIVRGHAYRETPWEEFHQIVDDLMASYSASGAGEG